MKWIELKNNNNNNNNEKQHRILYYFVSNFCFVFKSIIIRIFVIWGTIFCTYIFCYFFVLFVVVLFIDKIRQTRTSITIITKQLNTTTTTTDWVRWVVLLLPNSFKKNARSRNRNREGKRERERVKEHHRKKKNSNNNNNNNNKKTVTQPQQKHLEFWPKKESVGVVVACGRFFSSLLFSVAHFVNNANSCERPPRFWRIRRQAYI